jgi:membrane protease YdiL (CAAX protease family)
MKNHPLVTYFSLAYALTFGLSALATPGLLPLTLPDGIRPIAQALAHYGPLASALLVALIAGGPAELKNVLRPLGEWRVNVRWYLFIVIYPLAAHLGAACLDFWLGGSPPTYFNLHGVDLSASPLLLLPLVFIAVLFQAGLAEEIGWRGFALPRLQARFGALTSALILGALWAPWHYHPAQWEAIRPILGWHLLAVLAMSVLMTWVYNHTRGSLLIAVLFHTCLNTAEWIIPVMPGPDEAAPGAFALLVLLNVLVAGAVVVLCGPQQLRREPSALSGRTEQATQSSRRLG